MWLGLPSCQRCAAVHALESFLPSHHAHEPSRRVLPFDVLEGVVFTILGGLDINGNATLKAGTTLNLGNGGYTVRISGNWDDQVSPEFFTVRNTVLSAAMVVRSAIWMWPASPEPPASRQ